MSHGFQAPASPMLPASFTPAGAPGDLKIAPASGSGKEKEVPFAKELAALNEKALTIIVIGASGHLARTKTYPAMFALYQKGLLPKHVNVIGFARTAMKDDEFHKTLKVPDADPVGAEFLKRCTYYSGHYDKLESFVGLKAFAEAAENKARPPNAAATAANWGANRSFYLAIPPSLFAAASRSLKAGAMTATGWNRVVVEKPFGKDSASSAELSKILLSQFSEDQIYRIDHYLGKEMVQNLMVMRFANLVFEPLWNRNYISSVLITFKEGDSVEGRGGYFDEFGIIRDVMQNHLMQLVSLVAMEPPVSLGAEDVRNEKVKVLKAIPTLTLDKLVVGQYQADEKKKVAAYPDDPSVKAARKPEAGPSLSPTYASAVLFVRNPRWDGVPFILKCGKGLNERKAEVRIQFKRPPGQLFEHVEGVNELVLRVQPNEAVYLKTIAKSPGLSTATELAELDLTYKSRFNVTSLPDAYERLLLDVLRGDHNLFVRNDELEVAWRIFTPALHALEEQKVKPLPYAFGSRGPEPADKMAEKYGFVFNNTTYKWSEGGNAPANTAAAAKPAAAAAVAASAAAALAAAAKPAATAAAPAKL